MRKLAASAAAATAILTAGLAASTAATPSYAAAPHSPSLVAAASGCSIHNSTGSCPSGGEFCARSRAGMTDTNSTGTVLRCEQVGSRLRWKAVPTGQATPTPTPTMAAPAAGGMPAQSPMPARSGMPAPMGGVAAGEGGMALGTQQRASQDSGLALPVGLAAAGVAAGIGGTLVARRRRAASER